MRDWRPSADLGSGLDGRVEAVRRAFKGRFAAAPRPHPYNHSCGLLRAVGCTVHQPMRERAGALRLESPVAGPVR